MARRAHRVLSMVVLAVLLRMPMTFVSSFPPRSHRRLKPAYIFGRGKSQEGSSSGCEDVLAMEDILAMDHDAVGQWLKDLDLKEYKPTFTKINGPTLKNLTDEDLQSLGIDDPIHRKILLTNRDALVDTGFNRTRHTDSPLDGLLVQNDKSFGLEPQRLAHEIRERLQKVGRGLEPRDWSLIKDMDTLMFEYQQECQLLEGLEFANHLTSSHTAHVGEDQDQPSVKQEIEADLQDLVHGRRANRQRLIETQACTSELASAVYQYVQSVHADQLTEAEKMEAKEKMDERVKDWAGRMQKLAERANFCNEGLIERAHRRLRSRLPGGKAVEANIEELSRLTEENQKAAEKCELIQNLADRKVQLALQAREPDGLKASITHEKEKLQALNGRAEDLKQQRLEKERIKEEYQKQRADQRNATRSIRDWHIQRFWRTAWKPEIEVYEGQVKNDEERCDADCRALDADLEGIDKELDEVKHQQAEALSNIQEQIRMSSPKIWGAVLAGQGLPAVEEKYRSTKAQLKDVQEQLMQAITATGVANPQMAAQLIMEHEKSKILLSEATIKSSGVAERIKRCAKALESFTMDDSSTSSYLADALFMISDMHEEQSQQLSKKNKFQIYQEIMGELTFPEGANTTGPAAALMP